VIYFVKIEALIQILETMWRRRGGTVRCIFALRRRLAGLTAIGFLWSRR